MRNKREENVEISIRNLAAEIATLIYKDGDFRDALFLTHEFILAVKVLLTLRKMRSEGVVLVRRCGEK